MRNEARFRCLLQQRVPGFAHADRLGLGAGNALAGRQRLRPKLGNAAFKGGCERQRLLAARLRAQRVGRGRRLQALVPGAGHRALAAAGDDQHLARARHRHVQQVPVFLVTLLAVGLKPATARRSAAAGATDQRKMLRRGQLRGPVQQHIVTVGRAFHGARVGDRDNRRLKPLGAVNRHQAHRIIRQRQALIDRFGIFLADPPQIVQKARQSRKAAGIQRQGQL
ncbi:MAG TPA: hypothetical protein VH183_07265 [Burkholderiaceae bacterium]|nr:hypothetical protein [Burkholderiaceae bacterium]